MSGRSSGCAVGPSARCVVAVMALGLTIGACRSSSDESRGPDRPSSSTSTPPKTSTPPDASSGGTWSEIGWSESPLIQVAGGRGLAPDPANPSVLAYCVPGGVRVSRDGGSTWAAVAVRGVLQKAREAGFALGHLDTKEQDVQCRAVAVDRAHSEAVFATFMGSPADAGSFPFYLLPFATADGGRSWQSVRPPAGREAFFGGFAVSGGTVRALFYNLAAEGDCCAPGPSIVGVTSDGGRTWAAGTEACPARGPCVTWGPEATGNCAKGQPHQSVRHSGDGGRSWSSPSWPAMVSTCSPASLVSLTDRRCCW